MRMRKHSYLKKEIKWFEKNRKHLIKKHKGKWAVVHNQKLIGIFDSCSEAYDAGLEETNSEKLLVKQISEKDEPMEISITLSSGIMNVPRNI